MKQLISTIKLPRYQIGLTLVESMVAFTIGAVLSVGVIQVFISSKTVYKVSDSLGELQENGRSALTRLNHSIMMADHWGVMTNTSVAEQFGASAAIKASITAKGNCDGNWALQTAFYAGDTVVNSIEAYDGTTTIGIIESATGLPTGCITDYVAGSDILIVRYADSSQIVPKSAVANTANPNYANTIFIRGGISSSGKVLNQNATVIYGGDIASPSTPDQPGIYNYPFRVEIYFLKACSKTDSNGCINTTPTLTRLRLSTETINAPEVIEEAVAENIEQLQFMFGVDSDNNGFMNEYKSASDINKYTTDSLEWTQVTNVHVSFVARTDKEDSQYNDLNTYRLTNFDYTPADEFKHYQRKRYDQVIQIRNRTRS